MARPHGRHARNRAPRVHPANAFRASFHHVQVAGRVEADALHLPECRLARRTAVALGPSVQPTGNDLVAPVRSQPPDHAAPRIVDVQQPVQTERQAVVRIEPQTASADSDPGLDGHVHQPAVPRQLAKRVGFHEPQRALGVQRHRVDLLIEVPFEGRNRGRHVGAEEGLDGVSGGLAQRRGVSERQGQANSDGHGRRYSSAVGRLAHVLPLAEAIDSMSFT